MNRSILLALVVASLMLPATACKKRGATATAAKDSSVESGADVSAFTPDCTVTESSRSLGLVVLRDPDRRCAVFIAEPVRSGTFEIALSATPESRTLAAELVDAHGERLYASIGAAELVIDGEKIRGTVDARDDNTPSTGRLRIAIDSPLP